MLIKKLSLWFGLFSLAIANSIYASSSDKKGAQPLTYVEKHLIQNDTWDCEILEKPSKCNFSIDLNLPWFDKNNQPSSLINQEIFNITYNMINGEKNKTKKQTSTMNTKK